MIDTRRCKHERSYSVKCLHIELPSQSVYEVLNLAIRYTGRDIFSQMHRPRIECSDWSEPDALYIACLPGSMVAARVNS
jgi:hypothetical protein